MIRFLTLFAFLFCVASCNSTKETQEEIMASENSITHGTRDKIIVNLKRGMEPDELESAFTKYSLKKKSFASKSENSYLFHFDSESISAKNLIKKISKFEGVISANLLQTDLSPTMKLKSAPKKKVTVK